MSARATMSFWARQWRSIPSTVSKTAFAISSSMHICRNSGVAVCLDLTIRITRCGSSTL